MGIIREYILNIAFCSIIGASLAGIYCFFIYKKTKKNRGFISIILDDLILNLFGTLIGFLLSYVFMKKSQKDIV